MTTKKFNSWLTENSSGDTMIEITPDIISKLETDTGLSEWGKNKYFSSGQPAYNSQNSYSSRGAILYQQPDKKLRIIIPLMKPSNIKNNFTSLEDLLEVNLIPDYMAGSFYITIEFSENPDIKPGSLIMEEVKNWNNRHRISFQYNAKDYSDLLAVVNKGLDEAFEFLKDIRIVIPSDIKKIPGVKAYMEDKVREIYNKMLEEIRETGDAVEDIDNNIFAQLIITILEEHPNLMDDFNNLPEKAKDKWLHGVKEIFPDGKIEINKKSIDSIKAFLNVKNSFYLI